MSEKRQGRLGSLPERVAEIGRDYAAQTQQLEKIYCQIIPDLHRVLAETDFALFEVGGRRSQEDKVRVELLAKRVRLQAELDGLPGQIFWLKIAIVNSHRLWLKGQREVGLREAEKLNEQVSELNLRLNRLDAQIRELTRARRQQLVDRAEADGQISELRAEQRQVREALTPLLPALRRAKSTLPNDTAKRLYGLPLDASDEMWDAVAQRLAAEEREKCFLECFPRFKPRPWGRIDGTRPEPAGEHVAKTIN